VTVPTVAVTGRPQRSTRAPEVVALASSQTIRRVVAWLENHAKQAQDLAAAIQDHHGGTSVNFGQALDALKDGERVARSGWNGKGMFVVHQKGYPDGIEINANTAEATGIPQGTVCRFRPYLMMKSVDNDFVPWVASQTDLLAEDWTILDPESTETAGA
jgi:hypothetical protein